MTLLNSLLIPHDAVLRDTSPHSKSVTVCLFVRDEQGLHRYASRRRFVCGIPIGSLHSNE